MQSALLWNAKKRILTAFARNPSYQLTRSLHKRTTLAYDHSNGIGDFLTPEGAHVIAVDYQQGLLDRVNDMVLGTRFENMSLFQTVASCALDRDNALLFNYASQALNNAFFLDNLRPPPIIPDPEVQESLRSLLMKINKIYESPEHLQSAMSAAAMGMSGSGWVWLVVDQLGHLGIVATYGAGTLLVRSRQQQHPAGKEYGEVKAEKLTEQSLQAQHTSSPVSGTSSRRSGMKAPPPLPPREHVRTVFSFSRDSGSFASRFNREEENIGVMLNPLLCISVQEHAWLSSGYGVWGKTEYLKRFWTVVDWEKVAQHYIAWLRIRGMKTDGLTIR